MGSWNDASRMLNRLSARPSLGQQRAARREALQPVVNEARLIVEAHGNVISGKYRDSLGVGDKDSQTSAAGPLRNRPHATLGVLLEFGTAPHWQPLRQRMHPGAQAFPHMRPAFDSTKGQVVATLGRALIGSMFNV